MSGDPLDSLQGEVIGDLIGCCRWWIEVEIPARRRWLATLEEGQVIQADQEKTWAQKEAQCRQVLCLVPWIQASEAWDLLALLGPKNQRPISVMEAFRKARIPSAQLPSADEAMRSWMGGDPSRRVAPSVPAKAVAAPA